MIEQTETSWLYAFWAIKLLMALDKAIYDLAQHSNLNMLDSINALHRERKRLLKKSDFQRAQEQLEEMVRMGLLTKVGDLYLGTLSKDEAKQ